MPEINRMSGSASAAAPTASTEFAAATFPINANTHPIGLNEVSGVVNFTAGAGTTAVVVKVRQGVGTGGALVQGAVNHTLAAGASADIPFAVEDPNPPVGNQYTVTLQQTGGTAAGTVNQYEGQVYNVAGVAS